MRFDQNNGTTMTSSRVYIIHNGDPTFGEYGRYLASEGYQVRSDIGTDAIGELLERQSCDLLIVDEACVWPDNLTLYQYLQNNRLETPLIVISKRGSIQNAVEAVRLGVSDYLPLSADSQVIGASVRKALEYQSSKNTQEPVSASDARRPLIGKSDKMQLLLAMARRIAVSNATVLIQGESGCGKELLARYIHSHSERCRQRFMAMNCAALPEHLIESELFGYKRGAFTGAQKNRRGKFELADKGTLLLDEISEMQLSLQAKLLRVLQEKEIDPIGGGMPVSIDVRCIATTNRDLNQMVAEGKFREDLYFRLCVIPLRIPPLRERSEDIPELADFFIKKYCPDDRRPIPRFGRDAIDTMIHWPWPGNVRELENAVQRGLLLCDTPVIDAEALLLEPESGRDIGNPSHQLVGMTVKDLERKLIGQTLRHVNQNRTHAAKMLGISIRTLRNKLREYQQQPEATAASAGK
jgi:two-component system response regulator FlrC